MSSSKFVVTQRPTICGHVQPKMYVVLFFHRTLCNIKRNESILKVLKVFKSILG
jgi:hypothetical protein